MSLEEFIEMTFDLEAKSMYTFNGIGCYWKNKEKRNIPKLCTIVKPILLAFLSLYMVESGFSHMHYLLK